MTENLIRDHVTVDFDHHSPAVSADPYGAYQQLRSRCPVTWSPHHGGFWVLSDYASVHQAAEDDDTFRSAPGVGIPLMPYGVQNIPIDTDSPQTQQFRRILLGDYTPAAVERLVPRITAIADELIDGFIADGQCDIVRDFAMPLPARVILSQLGLPEEQWRWYVDRVHTVIHSMTNDTEASIQAGLELMAAVREQMDERRTSGLPDDQISAIMQGMIDGRPLEDGEIMSYILLMLFGGLDTTTGAVSNALVVLDRDRTLRQRLIDQPEGIPQAVEEFLRYDAPVQALGRTLWRDVEIGGQRLRTGDRALLVFASANRDPAAFDHPDEVDVERSPNRHLSFGIGLHRCLGANLGRVMFRVMLQRVLARLPGYRLAEDPERYRYPDAGLIYALRSLPIVFGASDGPLPSA